MRMRILTCVAGAILSLSAVQHGNPWRRGDGDHYGQSTLRADPNVTWTGMPPLTLRREG